MSSLSRPGTPTSGTVGIADDPASDACDETVAAADDDADAVLSTSPSTSAPDGAVDPDVDCPLGGSSSSPPEQPATTSHAVTTTASARV